MPVIPLDIEGIQNQFRTAWEGSALEGPDDITGRSKPFVALDMDTIQRGFLQGGVNSKNQNTKTSKFLFFNH